MTGRTQVCTHDGCNRSTVARRLCGAHYQAAWKAGELGQHEPQLARKRNRVKCPADHKHADSSTCYIQHQCRCGACMDHHSAMERHRSREKAYGRFDTGLVDVEPVREHMLMLGAFGLGYKRVAKLAGLGITPVRNILWGRQEPGPRYGELQKRVKRGTAQAILAVRPDIDSLAGGALIPARGTHRRVQALVARGWSQSKICERVGMERGNFWRMMTADHVTVATHRAVAAVFDGLWNVEPPRESHRDRIACSRAIHHAAARRWLAPLAWDDIDNDVEPPIVDDEGGVDDIAVELAVSGERVRLRPAERRVAVTRLHAARLSDAAIASRLHVTDRTVFRIRQELGLEAFEFADLVQAGAA